MMSPKPLRALLLVAALGAAIWWPTARFGPHGELGHIDALSIHGLSHARLDGIGDLPHVGLSALVLAAGMLSLLGVRGALKVASASALTLIGLIAARIASRSGIPRVPDIGLVPLLMLAVVAGRTTLIPDEERTPGAEGPTKA